MAALLEGFEPARADPEPVPATAAGNDGSEGEPLAEEGDWLFVDPTPVHEAAPPADDVAVLPSWLGGGSGLEFPAPDQTVEKPEAQVAPWRVGARAAALVNELDIPHPRQRARTLRWLEDLLNEFPHGASHAAIKRLVRSGISAAELEEAASIIRMWRADPSLWLFRRFDELQRRWAVEIDHRRGRTALSWNKAAALVASVDAAEAERLLCVDWRDRWLHLEPDQPGSGSYGSFACLQITQLGRLDVRLSAPRLETVDSYGWLSRLDPSLARAIAPDGRLAYHAVPVSHDPPKDKNAPATR